MRGWVQIWSCHASFLSMTFAWLHHSYRKSDIRPSCCLLSRSIRLSCCLLSCCCQCPWYILMFVLAQYKTHRAWMAQYKTYKTWIFSFSMVMKLHTLRAVMLRRKMTWGWSISLIYRVIAPEKGPGWYWPGNPGLHSFITLSAHLYLPVTLYKPVLCKMSGLTRVHFMILIWCLPTDATT